MSGAIIPDDWDGSTYKCWKVKWPDSLLYSAILLGNVSKPSFLDYWDAQTGDAQEAADAIKSAYNQTLPDFWTEDCEDTVLTTKSFRVRATTPQAIAAGVWTKVLFDEFVWSIKPITWNMTENAQDLTQPPSAGIWQYNAGVIVDDTQPNLYMALRLNNAFNISVDQRADTRDILVNTAWEVEASWTWLNLWLYAENATDISVIGNYTPWLTGHLVKPVEA